MVTHSINEFIDHTLLKPDATPKDIEWLCQQASHHRFFSVCVNPQYVAWAKKCLSGSLVKVCTVVGFPLGATDSATKAFECRQAIKNGADEIDMVIAIGHLKAGNDTEVCSDVEAVVQVAGPIPVKVILETSLLNNEEKIRACRLAVQAGASYVKTSTGFSGGGATVEDVALMRKTVGPSIGVKASGGIRDRATALMMIQAGATRLGTSSSVSIVESSTPLGQDGY